MPHDRTASQKGVRPLFRGIGKKGPDPFSARSAALSVALNAIGCETAAHGTTQRVEILSFPPGATATIFLGETRLITPAEVLLERERVHTVRFEKAGYRRAIAYLDRTTSLAATGGLLVGGVFNIMRDLETGAAWSLAPSPLTVELRPSEESSDAGSGGCDVTWPLFADDGGEDGAVVCAPRQSRSVGLPR